MAYLSTPKCLAITDSPSVKSNRCRQINENKTVINQHFFKSAQWTPDGTCIITNSTDNHLRTFIVPSDLIDQHNGVHLLHPYMTIPSYEPVSALAAFPLFQLQDSSSTLLLSCPREHPIRLNSSLTSELVASYPLVNPQTESIITPNSLLFMNDGTRFLAGSDSLISIFDISRPGQEPISSFRTGYKPKNMDWANPTGTYTRNVGLYDSGGQGECIGVFTVAGTAADKQIHGSGIHQLIWTPCGRYLYIVERRSNGVMLYDIRKTGQLLAWLEGRQAMTNQRISVDLLSVNQQKGHEIWGGGADGKVRIWSNPQENEGTVSPIFQWTAHNDAVSSTSIHWSGGFIATASGQRHFENYVHEHQNNNYDSQDHSLKIWSLEHV